MTMKNGFSTINRLLGKQRESSSNLSKSTTNLSVTKSTVNINDSSQVHQNRITPLPIATSNAPFEQTFRITVLLPRDQLYVARLGAKVRLHKLLQLVCENKQLDADKYEFQHPADPSQIFSCDLTIGAVGLSEIRLCNKSEHNNTTLRVDYVTSSRRNSFSSSKFSRNSKNISNTPSLYSSINSLNSMSSSGIDSNFRNISPTSEAAPTKPQAPVVPTRKKRLAPRPPSKNLTLEYDAASTKTNESATNPILKTEFVSTSNLDSTIEQQQQQNVLGTNNNLSKSNISIDCNGNTKGSLQRNNERCSDEQCQETQREVLLKSQNSLCVSSNDEVLGNDTFNSHNSVENISKINQPEPSPRRKVVQTLPKKSVPVAPPRSTKPPSEMITETLSEEKVATELTTLKVAPVALPRSVSSDNLIAEPPIEQLADNSKNVTKILMNQSPTVESNSILQTTVVESTPPVESIAVVELKEPLLDTEEPLEPSWNSSSTPTLETKHKSFIESSSEDDEMIKVYDLKLGKTIVKSLSNHKTSEVVGVLPNKESQSPSSPPVKNSVESPDFVDSTEKEILNDKSVKDEVNNSSVLEPPQVISSVEENSVSHVPSKKVESQNNLIIEDKLGNQIEEQRITGEIIKEEKIDVIKSEDILPQKPELKQPQEKIISEEIKEVPSVNIANESESLPLKTELQGPQEIPTPPSENKKLIVDPGKLEKPESKVIDDTITNGTQATTNDKQEPLLSTLERLGGDEELGHIQNSNKPKLQQIEVFEETATQTTKHSLATRSSSFLSLSQFELQNQRNNTTDEYYSRRRSSSELSIGESPSLQSIGVMKSILNSRKSSLCGSEESKTPPTECDIQSMEEPSPKSNNIFKTNKIKPSEEKIYRYSGPPNIQFSTWSERPKVQVSIKDEQDCTVDGSKNGGQKSSTTSIAVSKTTDVVVPQRNNHQNLNSGTVSSVDLVKNTQKVVLRENSSNSSYSIGKLETNKSQNSIPAVTIPKFILGSRTSWSVSTAASYGSSSLTQNNRPTNQPLLRPTSTSSSGSSSLTQNNRSTIQQPSLRPTSMMVQSNSNSVGKPTTPPSPSQPAFFGQGTLRKTGFKEKIVPLQDADMDVSKPISFTLKNNQTKPQIAPKTHIINSSRTEVPVQTTVPEAPPPPPIIRAVVTKQKTNRSQTTSLPVDPRDQLLSAIRSFKRDELKNSNI